MAYEVKIPAVGESVQEAMIQSWKKKDGDIVAVDDILLELETDKATVDIVAEKAGKLEIIAKEGQVVKVGEKIAQIHEGAVASQEKPQQPEKMSQPPSASTPPPPPSASTPKTNLVGPAVDKLAREKNIDLSKIEGSGPRGNVVKGDLLSTPQPTNHLTAADAKAATALKSIAITQATAPSAERTVKREPMSMLRRRIAERLLEAQHNHAILTTFNEVDMTAILEIRKEFKEKFKEKHGVGLGFMSFFVKACTDALKAFPLVNSLIDNNELVSFSYCDVGVAISTDKGLMVPVIRDAERLNFAQIEQSIVNYAQKARSGKIAIEDLSGGTFSITNGGIFGSLLSTPILNPPQSAILGMHKIQERPVAINGKVEIRPMMYLALSYDHRIVDGKEAVSFLVHVKDSLENPHRMLLGV